MYKATFFQALKLIFKHSAFESSFYRKIVLNLWLIRLGKRRITLPLLLVH
jgi:hypothetical protein